MAQVDSPLQERSLQLLHSRWFLDAIIERNNTIEYYDMQGANRTLRRSYVTANSEFTIRERVSHSPLLTIDSLWMEMPVDKPET